ncbi:type II toxin-antitoxin system prevent-host-death family antitoxin [Allorhizobium undicola]|uniref:type II toxin-antitoxin system prevent-host-death family antitoxin n=1 Tax=Allorhizobium undicola TaxID=78527 RepID=UPI003D3412C7
MDDDSRRRIRQLCTNPTSDTERKLRRALILQAGAALGFQEAKLRFNTVVKQARKGTPQVIGKPNNAVVLISVADLAALLVAVDDPMPTNPLVGVESELAGPRRRMVEERRNREKLKRRAFPGASPLEE